jgi:hypothetical protein
MDKVIRDKLKLGFKNDRFHNLLGWSDSGLHSWMSPSIEGDIWVIESEGAGTKYYRRFDAALNFFLKRINPDQLDVCLEHEVAFYNDYIPIADIGILDDDDLLEVAQ